MHAPYRFVVYNTLHNKPYSINPQEIKKTYTQIPL